MSHGPIQRAGRVLRFAVSGALLIAAPACGTSSGPTHTNEPLHVNEPAQPPPAPPPTHTVNEPAPPQPDPPPPDPQPQQQQPPAPPPSEPPVVTS